MRLYWLTILVVSFSVIYNIQGDCDEAFNYWEPLYFIFTGKESFQTWEYSPKYSLRSYLYLIIFGFPSLLNRFLKLSPTIDFILIRSFLGLISCIPHLLFDKKFSLAYPDLVPIFTVLTVISPSFFLTASNLLPSAIANGLSLLSLYFVYTQNYFLSIGLIAFMSIIIWPFCCILGIPILMKSISHLGFGKSILTVLLWAIIFTTPMVIVDSYFFGHLTIPTLNIIKYNVFGSIFFEGTSSELYGTEDVSYYLKNLVINFHTSLPLFLFALLSFPFLFFAFRGEKERDLISILTTSLTATLLWCLVFFLQPHKEERFIFPVYNLISISASLSLFLVIKLIDSRKHSFFRLLSAMLKLATYLFLCLFGLLSFSRMVAITMNYSAPIRLLTQAQIDDGNVICLGRDWHFFPNRYLLNNQNFHLQFIESTFGGQLPARFKANVSVVEATRADGGSFNLFNKKESDRFLIGQSEDQYCHHVLDHIQPYEKGEYDFAKDSNYTIAREFDLATQTAVNRGNLFEYLTSSVFYIPKLYDISKRRLKMVIFSKRIQ